MVHMKKSNLLRSFQLCSVFFFKAAGYQTALYHSRLNSTYWYSFDYKGPSTLYNQLFGAEVPPFPGGMHFKPRRFI
jgi:carboxylesterase type B